jgi:hypothetical protein
MKRTRVYVDTSVIGGCFDEEFAKGSRAVIQAAREGRFVLLLSDLLGDELRGAAPEKQAFLEALPPDAFEAVLRNDETARLRDAYLLAGVVGPRHTVDAHHIALATVWHADLVLSWNFKHIVHLDKIRMFNAVNLREGYGAVEIRSPREVM